MLRVRARSGGAGAPPKAVTPLPTNSNSKATTVCQFVAVKANKLRSSIALFNC